MYPTAPPDEGLELHREDWCSKGLPEGMEGVTRSVEL